MGTPTNTYDSTVDLNIGHVPPEIEDRDPAIYQELLDIHDALERIVASFTDDTNGIPLIIHDFFGDDHSNKPEAITTLVSLTTKIGDIIICNNIVPIVITLHPLVVSDPVTIVRANIGTVTIDGDGALIMGQPTQKLPLVGDAADLIGTSIGWKLT